MPRPADDEVSQQRRSAARESSLCDLHPQNRPRRGSSRNSIRCWRNTKLARPSSTANGTRLMTMAGSRARRWIGNGCLPISAAGRVDTVVVYKIDRLTRSLADFAKIVEILDARSASFVGSDEVPFAALAEREGVSPSYFTRLVRLSYLAPDVAHAILDGRQPRDLTAEKLLEHSRLPLAWHDQRTALGFA